MAKPTWLTIDPTSGSGNGTLQNSAQAHTGRVVRTGTVTVKTADSHVTKTYTVSQSPKDEFVSFNDGDEKAIDKIGGNFTIAGKSNSDKLTFALGTGDLVLTLPTTYTANGASTSNGVAITGDPGASSEYNFSVAFTAEENATVNELSKILTVTSENGEVASIVITQADGDATLSLSETSITIAQDGTAVNVGVTSNTSWTVS